MMLLYLLIYLLVARGISAFDGCTYISTILMALQGERLSCVSFGTANDLEMMAYTVKTGFLNRDCMTFVNLLLNFILVFWHVLALPMRGWSCCFLRYLGCFPHLSIPFFAFPCTSDRDHVVMVAWLSAIPSSYTHGSSSYCRNQSKSSTCPVYHITSHYSWPAWPSIPKDLALPKILSHQIPVEMELIELYLASIPRRQSYWSCEMNLWVTTANNLFGKTGFSRYLYCQSTIKKSYY